MKLSVVAMIILLFLPLINSERLRRKITTSIIADCGPSAALIKFCKETSQGTQCYPFKGRCICKCW